VQLTRWKTVAAGNARYFRRFLRERRLRKFWSKELALNTPPDSQRLVHQRLFEARL